MKNIQMLLTRSQIVDFSPYLLSGPGMKFRLLGWPTAHWTGSMREEAIATMVEGMER